MALKDIRTNLENYKFGMSEPVRIDAQIENGVDFFDNLEGGVTRGFTTKVVPGEHQTEYLKFYEGTPVGPRSHSGTYYADLNPIESRSSIYRDSSGNYVLPDTGVNTNPPGTQSGILKFTPPQTTLSLGDGFPNPLLNYIDDARRLQDSQTLLDPLIFTTELSSLYTSETSTGRSPQLIVQPSLARPNFTQPAVNWTFANSPTQIYSKSLDGSDHLGLISSLISFGPAPDPELGEQPFDLFGQFNNVPSGLNEQNQFGIDTFRNVANRGPHQGKNLHPVILRPITSTFNENNQITNLFSVPELDNTYATISIIDKQRLQKVFDTDTEQGGIVIGKQGELQRLNTNINTRILQPFSIIGMKNSFDDAEPEEKTPFFSPLRHSNEVQLPQTGTDLISLFSNLGFGEAAVEQSQENSSLTFDELVEQELNFPDGAGQNSLGRLFKNKQLSTGAMIDAYPNRYNNPEGPGQLKSSAPITIDNGIPSFTATSQELAERDLNNVTSKVGGNFHSQTNISNLERYATLSYGNLDKSFSYEKTLFSPSETLEHNGIYDNVETDRSVKRDGKINKRTNILEVQRFKDKREIADKIGSPGSLKKGELREDDVLNLIKGGPRGDSPMVDKINMITPFDTAPGDVTRGEVDREGGDAKDFIKFRFFDVMGQRYIILRAILSGISDSITTEYGEEKYMGRPDKLYVYKGADRDVSFTFKLYPKTKQELPVLIEKLDYVVGLCYPTYTSNSRMKTPFMELTIGDMFVDAPGILRSVNVTVEDNTTWEIDEGLQFPKHISVACQFRYIGSGDLITARGNADGALPVHYGGIRRTTFGAENDYQGKGIEDIQQSALGRAVDAYLGDNSFINTITEFAEDPVDFVEDALESVGNTFKGWFS